MYQWTIALTRAPGDSKRYDLTGSWANVWERFKYQEKTFHPWSIVLRTHVQKGSRVRHWWVEKLLRLVWCVAPFLGKNFESQAWRPE